MFSPVWCLPGKKPGRCLAVCVLHAHPVRGCTEPLLGGRTVWVANFYKWLLNGEGQSKAGQSVVWEGSTGAELGAGCIWHMASISWLPPPQPTARNGFLIGEGSPFCSFGTNPGQVLSGKPFYAADFFNLSAVFLACVHKLHPEWIWVSLGARPWQHWQAVVPPPGLSAPFWLCCAYRPALSSTGGVCVLLPSLDALGITSVPS